MSMKVTDKSLHKNCSPEVRELLQAVDYSYQKAADASGLAKSTIANHARQNGSSKVLSTRALEQVNQALGRLRNGADPAPVATAPDKGDLRLALVFTDTKRISQIHDAGEHAGGKWLFRKRLSGKNWLLILHMEDHKQLMFFKSIVGMVAEVITP